MFGIGLPELVVVVALAAVIVVAVLYITSLRKALDACSPQVRTLSPGLVWLLLIPLFNLIWHFVVVLAISKSLHGEFAARNMEEDPAPGRNVGLALCILSLISGIPHGYFRMPFALAALVCWIIYWVKIAGYSARLRAPMKGGW